jgi:RNA polymerase sigma-70 factor (ECF subfamily)
VPANSPVSAEALLAHAEWVRHLARGILHDADAADDVAQETWLAALRAGPGPGRPLSSWLGRVARNFALRRVRDDARRRAHENSSPPGEQEPSAASLQERAELHRELVDAVLALDEPYRATILLRFFEGLAPRQIAGRDGIPVRTVQTRLARALAQLRERLDARSGRDRSTWMAALAAFVERPSVAGTATTATALTTVLKLAIVGLLLTVLVSAILSVARSRHGARASGERDPVSLSSSSDPAGGSSVLDASSPEQGRSGASASSTISEASPNLDAEHELRGRVTDSAGRPLPGARVELRRSDARGFDLMSSDAAMAEDVLLRTLASDDRGEFRTKVPLGRPFDLVASDPGFARRTLRDRKAGEDVVIVLTKGSVLHGRVTHQVDGSACPGAVVRASEGVLHSPDTLLLTVHADGAGEYRFDDLVPGDYEVCASSRDGDELRGCLVRLREGEPARRDLVLGACGVVTGVVTDATTKAAIEGAEVAVAIGGGSPTRTDSAGRYEIRVPPAYGQIRASKPGYASADAYVTVSVGEPVDVLFELRQGRSASGRILGPDGRPIAGALVLTRTIPGQPQHHSQRSFTRTETDGRFRFADLDPTARHTLFVRKDGCATAIYEFPIPEADVSSIELGDLTLPRPATLRGRVVDESGAPVPESMLHLRGTNADAMRLAGRDEDPSDAVRHSRWTRSDERGRFAFADLAPGNYTVNTGGVKGSAVQATADVVLVEGEDHGDLDLVLHVGLAIDGRVVDAEGNPVPGCSVSAWISNESGLPVRLAYDLARGDGGFHLQGLDAGSVTIEAELDLFAADQDARGFAQTVRAGVAVGTRDLVVLLPHAGWIRGIVLLPDGSGAADTMLQATFADEPGGSTYLPITARADRDGRFRIQVDPTRRYDLEAFTAPHQVDAGWRPEFTATAEGVDPESKEVVLRLAPPR